MRVSWKLPDASQTKVAKIAKCYLFERLVREEGESAIGELPPPARGSSTIIQTSFLRRLLSEEIQLKSATQSDVCAAQSDLRQLSLVQLLALRVRNIDFATVSSTHSAHIGFLATVDALLLEKLAERGLGQEGGAGRVRPDALRSLGSSMLLVIGAAQVLAAEAREEGEAAAPVPTWWGFRLGGGLWDGTPAALFRMDQLGVHLLGADAGGLDVVADGELVAVAPETAGSGRSQALNWKVVAVDPRQDDVLAELMATCSEGEKGKRLHAELAKAVREIASTKVDDGSTEDTPKKEEVKSFLVTPPVGKVSAAIRDLQGRTPQKADAKSSRLHGLASAWTKSGWRWRKSGMARDDSDARRRAIGEVPSAELLVSRQVTDDTELSSSAGQGSHAVLAQVRQLSGDSASTADRAPTPLHTRRGKSVADAEELAKLLEMFGEQGLGAGVGDAGGYQYYNLQFCSGPRTTGSSEGAWSFLSSFVSCGGRG